MLRTEEAVPTGHDQDERPLHAVGFEGQPSSNTGVFVLLGELSFLPFLAVAHLTCLTCLQRVERTPVMSLVSFRRTDVGGFLCVSVLVVCHMLCRLACMWTTLDTCCILFTFDVSHSAYFLSCPVDIHIFLCRKSSVPTPGLSLRSSLSMFTAMCMCVVCSDSMRYARNGGDRE